MVKKQPVRGAVLVIIFPAGLSNFYQTRLGGSNLIQE